MKINWGTSIVLAFGCFIVFIMFFVIKTFTQKEYEYDLVSSHYYEDELAFQKTINNAENRDKLENKVLFENASNLLKIVIPNPEKDMIVGKIQFYRPSNDKLDFTESINSNKNEFVYSGDKLVKGRWNVAITWHYKKDKTKVFYKKQELYFE